MNTMQFFNNARAYVPASIHKELTNTFPLFQYRVRANPIIQQLPEEPPPELPINENKIKWGEATWFLLHTLSYKIKSEAFLQIKEDILQIIYTICTNLPCPTCSNHAKEYLDTNKLFLINSKDGLQKFLYTFHNVVNKRKGYAFFDYAEFEDKYSKAITNSIIQNFMFYFRDKSRVTKLMASDFNRTHIVKMLTNWFQKI